jgi:hypothetical protein
MLNIDRKQRLQRLAYYACAVYALAIAVLLHWRIEEEAILGYDPNHDGRATKTVFLFFLSGLSGFAAGRFNTGQVRYDQARDAMLTKHGIESQSLSSIRWAQIAGIIVMCSALLIVR